MKVIEKELFETALREIFERHREDHAAGDDAPGDAPQPRLPRLEHPQGDDAHYRPNQDDLFKCQRLQGICAPREDLERDKDEG